MIVCATYRLPYFPVTCIRDELKPNFIDALLLKKEIIFGEVNSNRLKTSFLRSGIIRQLFRITQDQSY